jgi:hypothetical protein
MSLLPFFTWCEHTAIGEAIRNSQWLFPVIESVHLLALILIAGAVLVVDMRLFGVGLRRQPVALLARDAQPWLIGGLIVMLSSGILLFLAEAIKCYYSPAFAVKMTSLFLALVFTFTARRKVTLTDESRMNPWLSKLVAVVSVTLWTGVGIGGRWIGFS